MGGLRRDGRRAGITFVVLLLAALLAALPASADPRDKLEKLKDKQQQVDQVQEELAEDREDILGRIKILDERRAEVESRVSSLDAQLADLDAEITVVRAQLTRAQQKVALLTQDLQEVLEDLGDRTDSYSARAVATYMAGPTAYVEGILASEDFSDLVSKYEYYEAALDADSELVGEIQVLRDDTEIRRELIIEKQAEINVAKAKLEENRTEVAALRSQQATVLAQREEVLGEKEAILGKIETDQAQYRALEDQLEEDSRRFEAILAAQASQAPTGAAAPPTGGGQLLFPAQGPITSGYGYRTHPIFGDQRMHTGIDIGAPYGSPVIAADDGVVTYAGVMSGYGNVIVVDHGGGLATTYNHLDSFSVGSGQSVSRGSQVGAIGCSGYCTGPHLHFEVRVNGSPVDPMPYL